MEEILESDLPLHIQASILKSKIKIMVEQVKNAGLADEFLEFMETDEINDANDAEEVFVRFAKKHPDKFYIVPEEEIKQGNKLYYCSMGEKKNER